MLADDRFYHIRRGNDFERVSGPSRMESALGLKAELKSSAGLWRGEARAVRLSPA